MDRRDFLISSLAVSAAGAAAMVNKSAPPPRFAHRQAQMITEPGQSVFQLAAKVRGLSGVQLQMIWKGSDIFDGRRTTTASSYPPSPASGSPAKTSSKRILPGAPLATLSAPPPPSAHR